MTMRQTQSVKKGQMALYAVLLAVVVGSMVGLSLCDKPKQQPQTIIRHSGGDTIDIAIEYSPLTYYSLDDTLGGYSYDLLRLIAQMAHQPMKFHPIVTLQKALQGLEGGSYDVLVAQYPMTAVNRERYAFTEPIYIDRQVLVQRKSQQAVRSQLDLAGDTVWVVKGSPMAERVASLSREIGDTIYVRTEALYGPEQLMMMVSQGEIRYAVVNMFIARAMRAKLPNLDTSVPISLSQFQSWVVRKDRQALCDSLNSWHEAAQNDTARYRNLQRRYFGGTFPTLAQ